MARSPGCVEANDRSAIERVQPPQVFKRLAGLDLGRGFDVDEIIRRRGGRPLMGSAAASVESVRLEPELSQLLHEPAEREEGTHSDVIRAALRRYLHAS